MKTFFISIMIYYFALDFQIDGIQVVVRKLSYIVLPLIAFSVLFLLNEDLQDEKEQ